VNLDLDTEQRLADAWLHHRRDAAGDLQRAGRQGHQLVGDRPVLGPDGKEHRWVYLHYFKEGQPS
jgi:hypothetical protein